MGVPDLFRGPKLPDGDRRELGHPVVVRSDRGRAQCLRRVFSVSDEAVTHGAWRTERAGPDAGGPLAHRRRLDARVTRTAAAGLGPRCPDRRHDRDAALVDAGAVRRVEHLLHLLIQLHGVGMLYTIQFIREWVTILKQAALMTIAQRFQTIVEM